MKISRPVTVRHPHLSLWQSAVASSVRKSASKRSGALMAWHDVNAHPMMQSANAHILAVESIDEDTPRLRVNQLAASAKCSMLHQEIAEAIIKKDFERVAALREECRKFATCNTKAWLNCERVYLEYRLKYKHLQYRDWKTTGKGDPDFGVIKWRVPDDAKVGLIADWGTGTDDASGLLEEMMDHGVDVIIHLGDIYYSGTPEECERIYAQIQAVFQKKGRRVPIFNLPGNHDYYALGYGFYPLLDKLNKGLPTPLLYRQAASFFCLRTAGGDLQFLGMDTGQGDCDPVNAIDTFVAGPKLRRSELQWHRNKLKGFKGETILLSHHQLFSTNAKINGSASGQTPLWLNNFLLDGFAPYFDSIPAWFWGHEHNLVFYNDGFRSLAKGRLIGCAGYEESQGESPYKPNYPVPYLPPVNARTGEPVNKLGVINAYYNHGYAILDLATRETSYYQIASWEGTKRKPLPPNQKALVFEEVLSVPQANMLNFAPPGMLAGHTGRWDGSPNGMPVTWFNLNKLSGKPAVKKLTPTELHLAGPYDFLGIPTLKYPTGRRKGTINLRIWNVGSKSNCNLRFILTGALAEEHLGKATFDTGVVAAKYTYSSDGSITYKGGGSTLWQMPFPKDAIWYPGIQFNYSCGKQKFFLCYEDMKL